MDQYQVGQARAPYLASSSDYQMKELPPILHAGKQPAPLSDVSFLEHQESFTAEPINNSAVFHDAHGGDRGRLIDYGNEAPGGQLDQYYSAQLQNPREARKGIWTYDDRHAFQRRSIFTRIFRVLAFIFVYGIWMAIVAILLVFLFVRPPNLGVKDPDIPSVDAISYQDGEFQFAINISAMVSNPNSVPINIKEFKARLYDESNRKTSIGNCTLPKNFEFHANANTSVTLPCTVAYNTEKDPNLSVLSDLVCRCGFVKGSKKSQIKVRVN